MEFFRTAPEAMYNGYRPCRLCRPLDAVGSAPPMVQQLMRWVDDDLGQRRTERDLRGRGIDPSTARRQFRRHCGMTFAAYQRARRMGTALTAIRRGAPVIGAQMRAGFSSDSGFREAFSKIFGTAASQAAGVTQLCATWIATPLGPMVGVCDEEGIALIDFVDRKGLEKALPRLRKRFGTKAAEAVIMPGKHKHLETLARELSEYFAGSRRTFTVPMCSRGTPFEMAAWKYLKTIPYGQTRTYADEARALVNPRAVRAVGRANGMNYLSIIIPCHRVIASSGELAGYGGGLARKRWLLAHEAEHSG